MFGEKWHLVQSDWNLGWVKGLLEDVLEKQVTQTMRAKKADSQRTQTASRDDDIYFKRSIEKDRRIWSLFVVLCLSPSVSGTHVGISTFLVILIGRFKKCLLWD